MNNNSNNGSDARQTIYALASARGVAGVAVIRVSGPQALEGFCAISDIRSEQIRYRKAQLCELKRCVSRETLDHALILAFKAPHSYTGETIVEYHVHGGVAVIDGVLEELGSLSGHRLAEPGEFTRRAFENGKMDLTEAEAVADLIHAQTTLQQQQALSQMGGALGHVIGTWRDDLSNILAYVEAEMEFPDEDLPIDINQEIRPQIIELCTQIDAHLNDNRRGERLRDGIKIAIIGAPNAGKSSLVNMLAQRDIAIVSDIAGTTRDVIEAHLDIGGYPVILSDTAGLRPDQIGEDVQGTIESEGIRRALLVAEEADIRVILYDGATDTLDAHSYMLEDKYDYTLAVINKADMGGMLEHPDDALRISVRDNQGIDAFLKALISKIEAVMKAGKASEDSEAPIITRQRHRTALIACRNELGRSIDAKLPELIAEDLRLALRDLGRITGKVDVEDLLDIVFRDFCVGK
ncbi:MAG: tRNA uridine-5-carboxymethylaminomethyl(34) synthesis GTPase MnmE [Alphaproteobacteria bacterium]|nr:tRNA uridine-5-carboxymethylaminomethyl(34) synthesis GTPase MnmE [Alphaproteobacteria bacterium]